MTLYTIPNLIHITQTLSYYTQNRQLQPVIKYLKTPNHPDSRYIFSKLSPSHMDSLQQQLQILPELSLTSKSDIQIMQDSFPYTDQISLYKYIFQVNPSFTYIWNQVTNLKSSSQEVKSDMMVRDVSVSNNKTIDKNESYSFLNIIIPSIFQFKSKNDDDTESKSTMTNL
jgi:hypothetical protein